MGLYDEVHTGVRCGQTKALGRGLGAFVPGDPAQIFPAPMNELEHQEWLNGNTHAVADSGQVMMCEGDYLTISDGAFIDWVAERDSALPLFTNLGIGIEEPVDLTGYLYLDDARASALEAAANGDFDRWPDPAAEAAELALLAAMGLERREMTDADRTAATRAAAKEQLHVWRGEPVDCPVCAAVVDGSIDKLRASRRQNRSAAREDRGRTEPNRGS